MHSTQVLCFAVQLISVTCGYVFRLDNRWGYVHIYCIYIEVGRAPKNSETFQKLLYMRKCVGGILWVK